MADVEVRTLKEVDLKGGTVVAAFPSIGLVSTITATYMITNLKTDQVVALESPDFPSLSMIYAKKPKFPAHVDPPSRGVRLAEVGERPRMPLGRPARGFARGTRSADPGGTSRLGHRQHGPRAVRTREARDPATRDGHHHRRDRRPLERRSVAQRRRRRPVGRSPPRHP